MAQAVGALRLQQVFFFLSESFLSRVGKGLAGRLQGRTELPGGGEMERDRDNKSGMILQMIAV
jgi:hypothetical protein